ncbi:MAG: metallophosphoesterase [Ignavibacteria bacterium]|nr:metallophosphoesterase [Ignavibacteria bacterium]
MIQVTLIIFTIIIINSILIFVDIYLYNRFKRFVFSRNLNPLLPKFYLYSIPLFGLWLLVNSILRWTNPIPTSLTVFSNYFLTFWYLPKLLIFIVIVLTTPFRNLVNKLKKASKSSKVENQVVNEGRRKLITALGWGAIGTPYLALAHESFRTSLNPKVTYVDIPINNLPSTLSDVKFVQISDIHAGSIPSKEFFDIVVFIINSLRPDFVFITGDFINFSPKEIDYLEDSFKSIRANISVLACPGNHEHYMKDSEFTNFIKKLQSLGIDILVNENRVFRFGNSVLQIAGMDNTSFRMNYGDLDKTLNGLDPNEIIILLSHDPTNWDRSVRRKRKVDLMLSGHTHGGQIAFEIFNSKVSPAAFFYKQYAGLYSDGDQSIYVNTGIGMVGVPVRAGLPPEITLIKLISTTNLA